MSVGSSLDELLGGLEARVKALRSSAALRHFADAKDPATIAGLHEIDTALCVVEPQFQKLQLELQQEARQIQAMAALKVRAESDAARLQGILARMPRHLPGRPAPCANPPRAASAAPSNPATPFAPPLPFGPPPPTPPSPSSPPPPRAAPATAAAARLALVTRDELANAPSYMTSRIDVARVNAAAAALERVFAHKYRLLATPRSALRSLPDLERKQVSIYLYTRIYIYIYVQARKKTAKNSWSTKYGTIYIEKTDGTIHTGKKYRKKK